MPPKYTTENMSGKRYGNLTVVRVFRAPGKSQTTTWFECLCDCGTTKNIRGHHVIDGDAISCGCKNGYHWKRTGSRNNMAKTKVYHAWVAMNRRCDPTKNHMMNQKNYVERGITVCDRWKASFDNFLKDMGEPPPGKYALDRIDNDNGYSPDNCRWATYTEQNRNRRSTLKITHDGLTLSVAKWSERLSMSPWVIYLRLSRGWSHTDALTIPVMTQFSRKR